MFWNRNGVFQPYSSIQSLSYCHSSSTSMGETWCHVHGGAHQCLTVQSMDQILSPWISGQPGVSSTPTSRNARAMISSPQHDSAVSSSQVASYALSPISLRLSSSI